MLTPATYRCLYGLIGKLDLKQLIVYTLFLQILEKLKNEVSSTCPRPDDGELLLGCRHKDFIGQKEYGS
ncbi:hypothetical protein CMV_001861 [Castanea mollissima]|uniref:Uncharacterized protein n=1 Tax=Castanea mollissima TaxID=60419 RepID=A0A8J4W436_9ROSI|nr:hypothetical protein CMV_001861 [Castanea mollissima]